MNIIKKTTFLKYIVGYTFMVFTPLNILVALDADHIYNLSVPNSEIKNLIKLNPKKNPQSFETEFRQFITKKLSALHVNEQLTPTTMKRGGFGAVLFTPHYAIKFSRGITRNGISELDRLMKTKNALKEAPAQGFNVNVPRALFKLHIDNTLINYNIQIMDRLKPIESMSTVIKNAIIGRTKDLNIIESLGRCIGQFQLGGLIKQPGNLPDLTYIHGDMRPANIMITNCLPSGHNARFALIDLPSFHGGKNNGAGYLTTDLCYFSHCAAKELNNNYTGYGHMLNVLYKGYISVLPQDICLKLREIYINKEHFNLTLKDEKSIFSPGYGLRIPNQNLTHKISPLQENAFYQAFIARFPNIPATAKLAINPKIAAKQAAAARKAQLKAQKMIARKARIAQKAQLKAKKTIAKKAAAARKAQIKRVRIAQKEHLKAQKIFAKKQAAAQKAIARKKIHA